MKVIIKSRQFQRFLEILIPLLSWMIITLPLWLSPFHPAIVAYFIITFDLYFFYKSIKTAYFSVLSYKEIDYHQKIDYQKKALNNKQIQKINHFIIIPNFKEPINKLLETIKIISQTDYPFQEKLTLVLAFEKREKEAKKKASIIISQYHHFFKKIICYYHPLKTGEEQGKASNQTYAAKQLNRFLVTQSIDPKLSLITICDADSSLPKNYFSYLSYKFITDKNRDYHFYWAPVLLYNNFWKLPFVMRIQATLSSIIRLSSLSQKDNLIQVSTYSTNFWLLKQINYWDVDIIPEDWHVFFQAFFKFGDLVKTVPLFTIVNSDAVYSGGLLKTFANRYEQEKRWAWGVSDVGYAYKRFFNTPHLSFYSKIKKLLFVSETHLFWPVAFFILTISASIPPLINSNFNRTVLGFYLPKMSGAILTLSSTMLLLYMFLDIKLRHKINQKTKLINLPLLVVQWYLLPIVSFFFSSLPALDAHTRILLGKKLKYKVTEKA